MCDVDFDFEIDLVLVVHYSFLYELLDFKFMSN